MTSREGTHRPGRRGPLLAGAIAVLVLVPLSCLASGVATRRSLAHARDTCSTISPGTPLLDARRSLADRDGAALMGTSTSALSHSELHGVLGHVVGWECQLDLDAGGGTVTRAQFLWWMVNDFHGRWDDRINLWIEAHLL